MAIDPYLQKQVELGMDGADIMHGHLKTLMLEAEQQLELAQEAEDESEDKELIDHEIHNMMGEELLAAMDAKDKKRILESIEAIVLNCLNKG